MTGREVGNWEEQRGEIFEWSAGAVVESAKRSSRPWAEEGRRRDDQAAAAGDGDAGRMQCNATLAGGWRCRCRCPSRPPPVFGTRTTRRRRSVTVTANEICFSSSSDSDQPITQ